MTQSALPGLELPPDPEVLRGPLAERIGHLVVNVSRRAPCDIYVGRNFAGRTDVGWGNPLRVPKDLTGARGAVLVEYFAWLNGPSPAAAALRGRLRAGELIGKVLGCWCAPRLCHGHVLAGLANGALDEVRALIAALAA